jgi:hypothetical protein
MLAVSDGHCPPEPTHPRVAPPEVAYGEN